MRARRWAVAVAALAACACKTVEEPAPAPAASTKPAAATAIVQPAVDPCADAKKGLDDFIATLDATCKKDEDCGGFFLREDTCAGPTILHVPGCPPEKKGLLFGQQANVRKSCPQKAECTPPAYKAVCRAGRCVDALAR